MVKHAPVTAGTWDTYSKGVGTKIGGLRRQEERDGTCQGSREQEVLLGHTGVKLE